MKLPFILSGLPGSAVKSPNEAVVGIPAATGVPAAVPGLPAAAAKASSPKSSAAPTAKQVMIRNFK